METTQKRTRPSRASKYDDAFNVIEYDPAQTQPEAREEEPTPPPPQPVTRKHAGGRPAVGKRSNPDYYSTNHFFKLELYDAAFEKRRKELRVRNPDMSDLLNELLEKYVSS